MSLSLTYQELPEWLLEPLMNGHLLAWEAAELFDHCLMATEEVTPLPKHLHPAAERLHLLEVEADPTRH